MNSTRHAATLVVIALVAVAAARITAPADPFEVVVGDHANAPTPYSVDHARVRGASEELPATF